MRVLHILPRIVTLSSGPSYTVPRLCEALADHGAEVELCLVGDEAPFRTTNYDLTCFKQNRFGLGLCASSAMRKYLCEAAKKYEVIHNHSLWLMPNVYGSWAVKNTSCKYVVSARGTLSSWALNRSRWKKRLFWAALQKQSMVRADLLHATAQSEYQEIRDCGLKAPVVILPNGVDTPKEIFKTKTDKVRRLLFLSRLHPKKGLEELIRAWAKVEVDFDDWVLSIAGPDQHPYADKMKCLVAELGLNRVEFLGEVVGEEKERVLTNANLYILPTHSENFGVAIAEALAHGVPVIAGTGAPWGGVVEKGCGWWISPDIESIVSQLEHSMRLSSEDLEAMGALGRRWMKGEYSWDAIASGMLKSYEALVSSVDSESMIRD